MFESRLGRDGLALGGAGSACRAVEDGGDLAGDLVGRQTQRLVDVNVALRHAARGVAEQGRDREFGEAEVAGDAGKGMAQGVRRHIGQTR